MRDGTGAFDATTPGGAAAGRDPGVVGGKLGDRVAVGGVLGRGVDEIGVAVSAGNRWRVAESAVVTGRTNVDSAAADAPVVRVAVLSSASAQDIAALDAMRRVQVTRNGASDEVSIAFQGITARATPGRSR